MRALNRTSIRIIFLLAALTLSACTHLPTIPEAGPQPAYIVEPDRGLFSIHSPVIVLDYPELSYNKIGTPKAELDAEGNQRIYVDPSRPSVYALRHDFETGRGKYTNLYYRVHFERVPFNLLPFNVSAGKNTGLIVVVTLNQEGEPLLYTTVHSCGCYLAIIPTTFLPDEAFPPRWRRGEQRVYGEKLPGLVSFAQGVARGYRAVIKLRSGSHRVRAFGIEPEEEIQEAYRLVSSPILALDALETLPMGDGSTTSFFETEGPRKGYVKGSNKPWEKLFISWWALDWRVGQDKIFSPGGPTDTTFYTSLKFWNRSASDMEDFAAFLRFWGWGL